MTPQEVKKKWQQYRPSIEAWYLADKFSANDIAQKLQMDGFEVRYICFVIFNSKQDVLIQRELLV